MKIVFEDPTFSLQLLRVISQAYYGGADIGECLSTAYRIKTSSLVLNGLGQPSGYTNMPMNLYCPVIG
ncbi:MAG TPA: hypothetical protein VF884_06850 [Nitrososphaeraceae archaeon]